MEERQRCAESEDARRGDETGSHLIGVVTKSTCATSKSGRSKYRLKHYFLVYSATMHRALRKVHLARGIRHQNSIRLFSSTTCRLKDPWLLPNTPEHELSTRTPVDLPPLQPIQRAGEAIEKMRARLVYQSRKRGTLESDLLLSTFAAQNLGEMSEEELLEYDKVC